MIQFRDGVLAGIAAFYTLRFCVTGMIPGQCSFDIADLVQRLDSAMAVEVRR
jgi:hypothetical protein